MKKIASLLLVVATIAILGSCKQARSVAITYHCDLTHYYSRHTADLDKVKLYIISNGSYAVGTTFILSIYGKSDEACYEEGDRQASTYFTTNTCTFNKKKLAEILGEETEFVYSYFRIKDDGDTLIIASYSYNIE